MPDRIASYANTIIGGLSALLLTLMGWNWKRQTSRIDNHAVLHDQHRAVVAELDKKIQVLDLKKLDSEEARRMVDSVKQSHDVMQQQTLRILNEILTQVRPNDRH